jgi:hypothetical protein
MILLYGFGYRNYKRAGSGEGRMLCMLHETGAATARSCRRAWVASRNNLHELTDDGKKWYLEKCVNEISETLIVVFLFVSAVLREIL